MKKKKIVCLVICFGFLLQLLQPVTMQAEEPQTEVVEEMTEISTEETSEAITEEATEEIVEDTTEMNTEKIIEEAVEVSAEENIAVITEEITDESVVYTHTDENGNILSYTIDENSQAVIHGITLSGTALTIPTELDGYVVASVENENACVVTNPDISIPELTVSCASVGPNAFTGLNIGTLTMAEGITSFPGYVGTGTEHIWKQFGNCTIGHVIYEVLDMQIVIPQAVAVQPTILGIFAGSDIGTVSFGENVESIAPFLFCGSTLQMDELSIAVPKIGAKAFSGENIHIRNLILEEGVNTLGESPYATTTYHYYEQFAGAVIDNVILNSSTMALEHAVVTAASVTLRGPFYETEIGNLTIGESVGKIPELMFYNAVLYMDALELHVPEIGAFAFAGTDISIGTLTIGSEVETFAESYFSTTTNHRYNQFRYATIGKVDYQAVSANISHVSSNGATDYTYGMFCDAKIGELSIGEGVDSIPEYLFDSAEMDLESLTVNVREIGSNAFSGANISIGTLTIGPDVEVFAESSFSTSASHEYQQFAATDIGTVYYNATAATLSHAVSSSTIVSVYGMFQKAEIDAVYIGENVEVIPEYLFDSATMNLDSLSINTKEIGACAFAGASIAIGTLNIGSDVEIFAESYFSAASSHYYKQFAAATITEVNYEAVSVELTHMATKGATGGVYGMFWKADIGDVTIGANVEVIPEYLFDSANITLDELYLDVREVGANAFYGSTISIGTLTIGEYVEEFSESYYSTTSSHKYLQFGYADIGTVNFLPEALVLSNDIASISTTSTINAPFKKSTIGMLNMSENVTAIPGYLFMDVEMTLDKLTITADSVGASAFYSSDITIGELTIGENVSVFFTDLSGKSAAFGYNEITALNYNATAAGMDSPKTGTYGPFYYADIVNLNFGENVTFIDSCFFRNNTLTNSNVYALTADDNYKTQTLKNSYLPASTNLSIHYNSNFKTYFNYDAGSITWLCTDYLIEDGYGDVMYDEETGAYNIEVFKHCSVCGYSVTELEEADLTYELYLSIPLGISLNLDAVSLTYTGSDVIYAYGTLGNAYEGITVSVDTDAEGYGIAEKEDVTFDVSEKFSAAISGSTEYIISSNTLLKNAQLIESGNMENLNMGELKVSVDAMELLKKGLGTYEIPVPVTIELNLVANEETVE